jgi:Ca-activated chloride channel family protein
MLYNWWQHIEFAYPWLLPLELAIPYLIYLKISRKRSDTASLKVGTLQYFRTFSSWRMQLLPVPFILRCIALASLIIALARPQEKFSEEQTNGEGIDMVLCFDISGSMTSPDFKPDRLEAAKEIARNFVEQREGDRIGVVIFSSQSFTLCPITTDHNTVLSQINVIQNGYLMEDGTAIGSGLATSIDRLKDSKAKTKIVILMTDGVDFGSAISPEMAEELARLYGVKIYCIGIGSNQVLDSDPSGIKSTSSRVKLSFNDNLLKQISSKTGGQYFSAASKEDLGKSYDTIDELEKSKIKTTTYYHYTEAFLHFVLIGLALIVLELLLNLTVLRKFP